jgi:N-acetylmuramoyl-L-alanine amidase
MRIASLLVALGVLFVAPALGLAEEHSGFDADVGLDPGHSYADVGTSGGGLREFELTLDIALRVKPLLEERGYSVNLTRSDSGPLSAMSHPNSTERVRIEQEARIAAVGRVRCYVSIHFNGHGNPGLSGTETYYNPDNLGETSYRVAEALQRNVLSSIWEAGYPSRDRGVKSDLLAGKPYGHFFSLRGQHPSALVETLFLSNPSDAATLRQEHVRQAIAEGYSRGIWEYLAEPSPSPASGRGGEAVRAAPRPEDGPNSLNLMTISIASRTIAPDIFD